VLLAFVNDANARVHATSDVSGNVMGSGQDGAHMRCAFRLIHPSSGMSGGGAGLCQTPAGKVIDVSLNKA
jgi:hypothetical protein